MRSNAKYLAVLSLSLLLAIVLFNSVPANAATISVVMTEDFSDATIHPLLTNRNNTPISGGIADLDGADASPNAQGFTMDISSYNDPGHTGGPTVSWIMEAIVPDASTIGHNDTLLEFNGNHGLRYDSGGYWEMNYPDSTPAVTTPQNDDHVALVYTLAPSGDAATIAYYRNGVLETSASVGRVWSGANDLAGFGLNIYAAPNFNRGFDGSLDAIAFSTFTGTFNPVQSGGSDQFAIPEPGTFALLATGLIGLLCYAWRKRK